MFSESLNVISYPQDITPIAESLPRHPKDCGILIVVGKNKKGQEKEWEVQKDRCRRFINYIKSLPIPEFRRIKINEELLEQLPEKGIPDGLEYQVIEDCKDSITESHMQMQEHMESKENEPKRFKHDVMLKPVNQVREKTAIQQKFAEPRRSVYRGKVDWSNPINDLSTPCIYTITHPELFYKGIADPTNKFKRLKHVSEWEAVKHLLKWAQVDENNCFDWPFQKHKYWFFWAFNRLRRMEILTQTNHYLEKKPEFAELTIGEVAELLNKKDKNLIAFMHRVGRRIKGSASWFYKKGRQLHNAMTQLGCVTIFATYSFADYYDPNLHALFGSEHEDKMIKMGKVRDYPGIVALYWQKKMHLWRKHYYGEILKTKWWWGRSEFQSRGTVHAHDVATFQSDPGLVSLAKRVWRKETLLNKFKLENKLETTYIPTQTERCILIQGTIARLRIENYVDKIIKALNRYPDFDETEDQLKNKKIAFNPHPSQKRFHDIKNEELIHHYHQLLMSVQQHVCKSGAAGCLRASKKGDAFQCRFHYPNHL